LIREFRDFINKGNLVEIAVAFVMGVAFAAVVTSLTEDIVNPIIGKIFSVDGLAELEAAGIRYGAFTVAIINFLIVGFVMFLVVRAYNRMQVVEEEADPGPSELDLLKDIRDSLKARN
jgi:large conductance mechanosensitive channel